MARKFNISQWHAVSSNKSPIKVNSGVKYEDLKSIILNLYNHKSVKSLRERLESLYEHLNNYDNPHDVTIDQFDVGILDVIYEKWLQEGYRGEKKDLLDIIFNYVESCDLEELKKGESATKVTPVKVVHDFIEEHSNGFNDSHSGLLNRIFIGNPSSKNTEPVVSLMNYLGMPKEVWRRYNEETEEYEDVKLKNLKGGLGDEFSVILKVRYKDKDYLKIKGEDGCEIIFRVSKEQKKFKLIWNGLDKHVDSLVRKREENKKLLSKRSIVKNREEKELEKELIRRENEEIEEHLDLDFGEEEEIEYFGFKGYQEESLGFKIFKNWIDDEEDGWFGFRNQVKDTMGYGTFRVDDKISGDWFGFRNGVNNVFGEFSFYEEEVDPTEWFGFKKNTLNVFGEGVFKDLDEKDDNDVFFGFRGYTRNVFGESIFKTNIVYVYPVDPDDPEDIYFGYWEGTCNVFGEAPLYTEIKEEVIDPPVYPDDPDYTYVLDLGDIDSEFITVVVSLKDSVLRLYCENERVYGLPVVKVVQEIELMRYPIIPTDVRLDISKMGNDGRLFKDNLFNDDDNRVLEIYKGYFTEEELEYIFGSYR